MEHTVTLEEIRNIQSQNMEHTVTLEEIRNIQSQNMEPLVSLERNTEHTVSKYGT